MSLSLPHYIMLIMVESWGLDWLVRSHSRINVGATRDPFWVVTCLIQRNIHIWFVMLPLENDNFTRYFH